MKNTNHIIALISHIRDKANRLIIAELEKNSIVGLVPSHGNILQLLFTTEDSLTMREISLQINRDKSTVTALVNKLFKLGYIEKQKHLLDSRSTVIVLTSKGLALRPIFDEISENLLERVYRGIGQKERVEVVSVLEKINSNI